MTDAQQNGGVLVPIANPETVDRLLDTAVDIVRDRTIPLTAVHVVEVPPQVPLSEGHRIVTDETNQLLDYVEERLEGEDIDWEIKLRYARDTATGIVGSVDTYGGDALLMGWRGRPRRRDVILGSFLDRVLGEATCDVYIKRIKLPSSEPDSILVPVAGGPHDELAAELAGTLAAQHDAAIVLFHVVQPDTDGVDVQRLFRERRASIPSDVTVNERLAEDEHVSGAITDETVNHDLTILGATEDPFFKRRLVGSVAQGVGRSAASSVIVTRRYPDEA